MKTFEEMYLGMVKELYNAEVMITEYGFVQYAVEEEKICIMEVYVAPEFRGTKLSKEHPYVKLADAVVEIGKANQCTVLCGKINHNNPHKDKILHCHMWYGMKLHCNEAQAIWTYKEI